MIAGFHHTSGTTHILVKMKLMSLNLIAICTIVYGTIGDHSCNRDQILPRGIFERGHLITSQLVYHKSVSEFLKTSVGMLGFYFWIQFNIFAANVQKSECIVIWADPKARNLNKYTFCA